jgi:hypothetical protein
MRRSCLVLCVALLAFQAIAAPLPPANAPWPEAGLRWIKSYRLKPDPASVPGLIRALSAHGSLKDPESSGVFVGFLAGVLNANPKRAWSLIEKTLPLPFEDQWIVIRALAYSSLPDWRNMMRVLALHIPDRQVMANHYIYGSLPALDAIALEPSEPTAMEKVKGFFRGDMLFKAKAEPKRVVTFQSSPDLIDTLWGLYYATGRDAPILKIVSLLPWAKERDNVEKLTIGSMAKFTLASNAARDADLLRLLKRNHDRQPKEIKPILTDVIEAAETVDTGRIGKDAMTAVEELKRKGPGSRRDIASWGAVGEAALSVGCLGLAVAGQVEAGIPCVVGGALSSGALRYFSRTD